MELKEHDLHLVFDPNAERMSVWDASHKLVFACAARNVTTANGQYGHDGQCPPETYLLGRPVAKNTVPFGPWFIPLNDFGDHHGMQDHGRSGIGIHGGGSGLAHPLDPEQGWQITHGCLRVENQDLIALVHLVHMAQWAGGNCYITVQPNNSVPA